MKKRILIVAIIIIFLVSIGITLFINSSAGIYFLGLYEIKNNNYIHAIHYFSKISDYQDANDKLNECYYQIALKNIEEKDYEKAIENLSNLDNYKDSAELILNTKLALIECYLNSDEVNKANNLLKDIGVDFNEKTHSLYTLIEEKLAEEDYKEGAFKNAIEHLSNANVQNELLEDCKKLLTIQGTFKNGITINGWNFYISYINAEGETRVIEEEYTYSSETNIINVSDTNRYFYLDSYLDYPNLKVLKRVAFAINWSGKTEFIIDNNKLILIENEDECTIDKINDNTNKPNEKTKPKIGMSKNEVKNSSWGSPQKVNTTTNKYGTSEQWVYGNGKYLYFNDGILTSIQE